VFIRVHRRPNILFCETLSRFGTKILAADEHR